MAVDSERVHMNIGVMDMASSGWPAGGEYIKAVMVALLRAAGNRPDRTLSCVTSKGRDELLRLGDVSALNLIPPYGGRGLSLGERVIRRLSHGRRDPRIIEWQRRLSDAGVDVVFPFWPPAWWKPCAVGTCTWIPDFQHIRLPQFFTAEECSVRNEAFMTQAACADRVILSSEDAKAHFCTFAPRYAAKARVFRFPSLFACDAPLQDKVACEEVRQRYGIPENFLLVINQFWSHKNHADVIEACGVLKQRFGTCPQMVMIGTPSDYRDPSGKTLTHILSRMAELGLEGTIKILGFVPSAEKESLLRGCKALIQPSEFEGRNTSIEDARALGRPVIASDLAVHKEQLPDAFAFFSIRDVEGLADCIRRASHELPPGPDLIREQTGRNVARQEAHAAGEALWNIGAEVVTLAQTRRD
jgi:glycosyltransferase involved in cell wall biosynthesis